MATPSLVAANRQQIRSRRATVHRPGIDRMHSPWSVRSSVRPSVISFFGYLVGSSEVNCALSDECYQYERSEKTRAWRLSSSALWWQLLVFKCWIVAVSEPTDGASGRAAARPVAAVAVTARQVRRSLLRAADLKALSAAPA